MNKFMSRRSGAIALGSFLLFSALSLPFLMAADSEPAGKAIPKDKAGKRNGTVVEINTTNTLIKIRPRVVWMTANKDESTIKLLTVSYNADTKFVHTKKAEATVADLQVGEKVFISLYETNGTMVATHVLFGLPERGEGSPRGAAHSTNGAPHAVDAGAAPQSK